MRTFFLTLIMTAVAVVPVHAVEFLGIELCKGSVSTGVQLPEGSPLTLESAEIGAHGALLLLLRSDDKAILEQIDDLMVEVIGSRGVGDDKSLQWSGRQITAFAQILKKKVAALAVDTTDACQEDGLAAAENTDNGLVSPGEPDVADRQVGSTAIVETEGGAAVIPAMAVVPEYPADEAETAASVMLEESDFSLQGPLHHSAYDDDWVDVMGVVVNNSAESHNLAAFDLSLYDDEGRLICVDTISVAVLKSGQHRAFRDSIRCPGYHSDAVDRVELQFAGGR